MYRPRINHPLPGIRVGSRVINRRGWNFLSPSGLHGRSMTEILLDRKANCYRCWVAYQRDSTEGVSIVAKMFRTEDRGSSRENVCRPAEHTLFARVARMLHRRIPLWFARREYGVFGGVEGWPLIFAQAIYNSPQDGRKATPSRYRFTIVLTEAFNFKPSAERQKARAPIAIPSNGKLEKLYLEKLRDGSDYYLSYLALHCQSRAVVVVCAVCVNVCTCECSLHSVRTSLVLWVWDEQIMEPRWHEWKVIFRSFFSLFLVKIPFEKWQLNDTPEAETIRRIIVYL